jgi:hypothetical protein
MQQAQRRWTLSPFVVDKSKLTRLLAVTDAKLEQNDYTGGTKFKLSMNGGQEVEVDSLDKVFDTDNSARNRVERLTFMSISSPGTNFEKRLARSVVVDFDGRAEAIVGIRVEGPDHVWVRETLAAAEEQVERTFQTSFMHSISPRAFPRWLTLAGLIVGTLIGLALTALSLASRPSPSQRLAYTMWLTEQDLKELEPLVQTDTSLPRDKADEILSRQVHNLIKNRTQPALTSGLQRWRRVLLSMPFVVIWVAFAYLLFACYPPAVFLWGDAEGWYKSVESKRKNIWWGIIIALAVGVVGNLFVFALSSH